MVRAAQPFDPSRANRLILPGVSAFSKPRKTKRSASEIEADATALLAVLGHDDLGAMLVEAVMDEIAVVPSFVGEDLADEDVVAQHGRHGERRGEARGQVGVQLRVGLEHGLLGGVAADVLPAQDEQVGAGAVVAALVPVAALAVLAQVRAVLLGFEVAVHHHLLGGERRGEGQGQEQRGDDGTSGQGEHGERPPEMRPAGPPDREPQYSKQGRRVQRREAPRWLDFPARFP